MEKMAYLVEFWLIIKRDLVEACTHTEYFLNRYETTTWNTAYCNLTKKFGLTEFGSIMNKL
jgi:hypothetical protein